jgi:hypothetical protein
LVIMSANLLVLYIWWRTFRVRDPAVAPR